MQFSQVIFIYVSPVTGSLVIVLNLLQIIVMRKEYKKSPTKRFILNLSISDLLVGICIVATKVLFVYKDNDIIRELMFFVKDFGVRMSCSLSVLNLIAFTAIRVLAINKPLLYRKITHRCAQRVCVLLWIVTLLLAVCYYFPMKYLLTTSQHRRYEKLIFSVFTYTAAIIFVVCYTKILCSFRQHRMYNLKLKRCDALKGKSLVEAKNNEVHRKILQVAAFTVIAFIICWLPISTYAITRSLEIGVNETIKNLCVTVAFVNSVVNPILYFVLFKPNFLRLFFPKKLSESQDPFRRDTITISCSDKDSIFKNR